MTMNYEDRYNEALKIARNNYNAADSADINVNSFKNTLTSIFPEIKESEDKLNGAIVLEDFNEGNGFYKVNLAYLSKEQVEEIESMVKEWNHKPLESEDEKIRKEIIRCIKDLNKTGHVLSRYSDEWIAWLEKQKAIDVLDEEEREFADNVDSFREEVDAAYQKGYNEGVKTTLEKQGEQDIIPLDKVVNFLNEELIDDKDEVTGEPFINFQNHGAFKESFISYFKRKMLEKQGKQSSSQTNERAWLHLVSDILTWKDGIGQYLDDPRVQELAKKLRSEYAQKLYNSVQDAHFEQKPIENAEPKFHVGDWVVKKDGKNFCNGSKTVQFTNTDDIACQSVSGRRLYEDKIRLWTIQDAKDGDVLAAHECIVVFKKIDGLNIRCHCTYHLGFNPNFHIYSLHNKAAFHPATKEQRKLLFSKMKEAGYKWNPETKELNRLKQDEEDNN